jgi:predicted AlkP superfamily pyrophosphatase or phosphodiesterase
MSHCITDVTPTVTSLMDVKPPALCQAEPLAPVLEAAREVLGGRSVRRLLVYAPDAIGCHLLPRDPASFNAVRACAPVEVRLQSVHPSVTPVCFASMFTGAMPKVHGIRHYIKPVMACDTLFDALLRAGKRVAIVAVKKSSIDIIFRGRVMTYFSEDYDAQVTARAIELMQRDEHDFILAYHQEYDDLQHKTEPFSAGCLAAFQHHAASFGELCRAVDTHWAGYDRAVAFTPDHGAHFDAVAQRGAHGENIPEDMQVAHFWGVRAARAR